mmetsp:Transcript_6656/g.16286  ORF Transcript_6656/g.16286 Transcript_6656/m.16286 type:complete len:180 (+) Transcript_6656:938-1477(+)
MSYFRTQHELTNWPSRFIFAEFMGTNLSSLDGNSNGWAEQKSDYVQSHSRSKHQRTDRASYYKLAEFVCSILPSRDVCSHLQSNWRSGFVYTDDSKPYRMPDKCHTVHRTYNEYPNMSSGNISANFQPVIMPFELPNSPSRNSSPWNSSPWNSPSRNNPSRNICPKRRSYCNTNKCSHI